MWEVMLDGDATQWETFRALDKDLYKYESEIEIEEVGDIMRRGNAPCRSSNVTLSSFVRVVPPLHLTHRGQARGKKPTACSRSGPSMSS